MATINAIEDRTIHQIQSGQVIVDLCSVVKELVENSLDAGATSIDVRFKNNGLDSIEVQDNGDGITPQNYETVALKHYTSKLSSYSDLGTLGTFGFRGEALSSLCALSKFTITTCTAADAPKGTKLDFEVSGKLKSTTVVAAQKGTTVSVEDLFNNLPVRRKELERNIKREWNRVVALLGQYACVQTGVKMSVSQQAGKGRKAVLFSTKGNPSTRENIINVFGAKTLTALLTLDLRLELEPTSGHSQRWGARDDGETKEIHVVGHISRPAHGEGRQTPDRQMFFVNGRPCTLPQVAKAFNEVYKQYNNSQSPFIFANIEMDTHLYDVNVSPDKRTILLHDQSQMLEHLKTSIAQLFESQDYTVPISQFPAQKQPSYKQLTIAQPATAPSQISQSSTISTEDRNELEFLGRNSSRDQSLDVDKEDQRENYQHITQSGAISGEDMSRDGQAASLISDWLGKRTDDRVAVKVSNPARPNDDLVAKLSGDKRRLVEKLANEIEESESETEDLVEGIDYTSSTPASTRQLSRPAIDFNERLLEAQGQKVSQKEIYGPDVAQKSIPALQSPIRRTIAALPEGTAPAARPLPTQATIATVKIGDHTVTSTMGSPYPKRPRVEFTSSSAAITKALPSFGSRLSQRFAASSVDQPPDNDLLERDRESPLSSHGRSPSTSESSEAQFEETHIDLPVNSNMETEAGSTMHHVVAASEAQESITEESAAESSSYASPDEEQDGSYIDDDEKKAKEDAKVLQMIQAAENEGSRQSGDSVKRTQFLLKGNARRKDATVKLLGYAATTVSTIESQMQTLNAALSKYSTINEVAAVEHDLLDSEAAEEKLSLTINKSDFANLKIIGQFNLGFILASRSAGSNYQEAKPPITDDLFIIDQHASDEKYNFERLQANTIVQSQRLVRPKTLDLTAIEEEIVKENLPALETNGFVVNIDESGDYAVGQRCQLVSLPLSRETTFSLSDLEELISLLSEQPTGSIPRPAKVRKMFAMRACRSSIMIGRTLTHKQMEKVVKHMGEIDKPWNCPHGRPTMRHLCNLGAWDEAGWREGDGDLPDTRGRTDWAAYVRSQQKEKA